MIHKEKYAWSVIWKSEIWCLRYNYTLYHGIIICIYILYNIINCLTGKASSDSERQRIGQAKQSIASSSKCRRDCVQLYTGFLSAQGALRWCSARFSRCSKTENEVRIGSSSTSTLLITVTAGSHEGCTSGIGIAERVHRYFQLVVCPGARLTTKYNPTNCDEWNLVYIHEFSIRNPLQWRIQGGIQGCKGTTLCYFILTRIAVKSAFLWIAIMVVALLAVYTNIAKMSAPRV